MAWTPRERVLAVFAGEVPDRTPIFDYLIHDALLSRCHGAPIGIGDKEAVVRSCARFLDLCHPVGVPLAEGTTLLPDGTKRVSERWMSWDIPPAGRDPEDLLPRIEREIEENEAYEPDPAKVAAFRTEAAATNAWAGDMVYLHIGTILPLLPGTIEEGIYLYADHPELIVRWSKAACRAVLRWVDAVADPALSPVAINWNDIALKGALLYPLELFETLLFPPLRALCDLYHDRGMKVIFHSDGDVSQALDRLVACGVDGFNPLEISAGMQVEDFFARYGRRTALVGGMDAVGSLAFGTPASVAADARRLVASAGTHGRLIAGSSSGEIDDSMPLENVLAYFEAIRSAKPERI